MEHFNIEPNVGVGPIKLGMCKSEVESIFGRPDNENQNRCNYYSGFFVNYNKANRVEFIELANSNKYKASFKNKILFEIPATDAVVFVSQFDSYDSNDPELGYSYVF